jgi:hypothetical protein
MASPENPAVRPSMGGRRQGGEWRGPTPLDRLEFLRNEKDANGKQKDCPHLGILCRPCYS